MMRLVAIIALFACHAQAVQVQTGSADVLKGMVKMMDGLVKAAQAETAQLEKDCAAETTKLRLTRDSLRADLFRFIGAESVPSTDAVTGAKICTGKDGSTSSCGGEYDAAITAKDICTGDKNTQDGKADAARKAMNKHRYNHGEADFEVKALKCDTYASSGPADDDISVCATEWRIDFKEDQEASVARQCKKTNEIMEIAINIYRSKGMGASFIQLSEEENLRTDAKEFLQTQSGTERNAELLKLLHDFSQQVKRDCHQDISDLRADLQALTMHLKSKRNSAASEQRAYETATQRMHEAAKCEAANLALELKIHGKAMDTYTAFDEICPPKNPGPGADKDYQCNAAAPVDFSCEWLENKDRVHESCLGSLMHKEGYCKDMKAQQKTYIDSLQQGMATLNMVINGPSPSFIQLEAEQNEPAATALVQEGAKAVDFSNLVDAISQAMTNEITKLNADASDVNAFAQHCEEQLTPLDLPEGEEVGGCSVKGALCKDQEPLSATCKVCLQGQQCQELGDEAIVAANAEAQHQQAEDASREQYETAQGAYATAARERSEKRAEWARMKQAYIENRDAMETAQSDLQTFIDENSQNANAGAMNDLKGVVDDALLDLNADWNTYNETETATHNLWTDGPSSNPNAEAYHAAKTSTDCGATNADKDKSYYCDSVTSREAKLVKAAERSTLENSVFNDCTRTNSVLNKAKENLLATETQCKIGVTKDLKEELHKMSEALQILQQAKTKIAGTA